MTEIPADTLMLLKEYGLAGVMAWLFWWTLRRMMSSHDTTVSGLESQLEAQADSICTSGERFASVVENHLAHASDAIARLEACLSHHVEEGRRWQDRLLATLDRIAGKLEGS